MKFFKRKKEISDGEITCGERDGNGFCDTYKNGEKTGVKMLVFTENEIEKLNKNTENQVQSGISGASGCKGHSDWAGWGHDIECKDNYPKALQQIIIFRNKSIKKEWLGSLEHDVYGDTPEECDKKTKDLVRRVRARLDEINERYKPFDEAINDLIELWCEK